MLRSIIKCFAILFVVELLLFIGLIATVMTDGKVPAIASYFYWPLKYPLSFPLSLLDRNYPYFLDGGGKMMAVICLSTLNNLMLASILVGIYNASRRILSK